jgi:hypothetical protein
MAAKLSTATANALLNAITTAIGSSGRCKIYAGTVPTNVGDAAGTLLADVPLSATSFPAASAGSMSLNGTPLTVAATTSGTATYFRITTSGGTAVVQGTVGTSSADLILNTVALTATVTVSITSGTITLAGS